MRVIDFYRGFPAFLKQLPPKHAKQIVQRILALAETTDAPDVKKLQGYDDLYRADSGEYRIVFRHDPETLVVDLVGRRNDDAVYRELARRLRER